MGDKKGDIPSHKLIPAGKRVHLLVDGFQHAASAPAGTLFFLTHAHSDHYTGLKPDWSLGPIYCSEITARLITHIIGVDSAQFCTLPMDAPTQLPCGVEVTLIDANHCPGAVQFLFKLPDGRRIIHTGDFRFHSERMLACPHLERFKGADLLFLDTTYCNPRHKFPPQEESVEYVATTIQRMLHQQLSPSHPSPTGTPSRHVSPSPASQQGPYTTLFLIGTYVIGKERILQAVSQRCGVKIYISNRKAGVMACLGLPEEIFTSDPQETPVHVCPWNFLGETWPFFRPNYKTPGEYMAAQGAQRIVGFVPTGWVSDMAKAAFPVKEKGPVAIHLVPYSEHSSFSELQEYVGYLRPHRVVPTVGASDDKAVGRLLRHFTLLTDTTASKAKFLATLTRGKQAQFKGPRGDDGTESGPGPSNKAAEVIDGNSDDEDFLEIVDVAQADGASDQLPVSDEANAAAGVETLVSLSGGALAPEKAQELLNAADGDVGRAADLFFSGSWQPPLSAGTISNGNGKGVKGGEMPKKRAVAPSPGEAENGKRRKGDAGQRSILSFLGKEDKRMTPAASPKPVTEPQQQQSTPAPSPPAAAPGHSVPLHTTPMSVHKQGRALSQAFTAGDRSAEVPPTAVTLPLAEYNPISHAPWAPGEPTPYLHIARTFEAMDSTTKRLRISDALTNAFRSVLAVAPQDAVPAAYLAVGKVGPDYEGMELNVGGSTVAAAVSECTGVSRARLRSMYNELGDLGDVAAACKRTQATLSRPAPLTVPGVFSTLRGISVEKGQGAAGRRQRAVLRMLRSCREAETKYLVRTLVQALRVGANWRSVVPALAKAVCIHQAQAAALQQLVETAQQSVTGEANPPPLVKSLAASLPAVPSKAELDAVGAAATAAFHLCPNLELLLDALLAGPACEVAQRCHLTPGIPIKPMLAKISEGIADAVAQLKGADFLAEYKYDGVRAQIHVLPRSAARQGPVRGGSTGTDVSRVKVFSRNSEDRTASFPDVAAQVLEAAQGPVESFIIDAEVVSVERPAAGGGGGETAAGTAMGEGSSEPPPLRLRAFQELASRPRSAVETSAITVDVCVFVFDILEADGQSLLELPLSERRAALLRALPTLRPGYVQLAQGVEIKATDGPHGDVKVPKGDPEGKEEDQQLPEDEADPVVASAVSQVQSGLMEALACGAEGLMLKSLTARYEPSKRSEHWIKLKRDYCIGLHDTLDLVPIGAWYGSGRKAGWFSPFLMAVWDPEAEEFQSLCRCMSGFSDVFYAEATARLKETIVPTKRPYYNTLESPDVWFDAREVWELRGADLSLSPVHRAAVGRVHGERGLGLRFPRFLRIRDDKGIEDATSAATVAEAYGAQERKVQVAAQAVAAAKEKEASEDAEADGEEGRKEAGNLDI